MEVLADECFRLNITVCSNTSQLTQDSDFSIYYLVLASISQRETMPGHC